MESKVKLLGHPIHPMLVVFPVALFSVAVVFDVLYLVGGSAEFARFAFWGIGIGLLMGLLAGVFGLIDWLAIRAGSRAKRIGGWHGLGNATLIGLFGASWLLRVGDVEYAPNVLPFALALLGAGLSLVTAWLGAELVYRLRIGVDDLADADAPSSLSGPVTEGRERRREAERPARLT